MSSTPTRQPSTHTRAARLDALPGAQSLAPLLGREPPTERRIFPAGELRTTKGTFLFTPRSAEAVMAAYRARGVRCWYDFNHQGTIPGARAPAAAFMDLEVRDSATGPELWAVNIKWADDAAAEIRQGNWGYDSAWFLYDETTREITELCNVALTNDPATLNLPPLVAVASRAAGALLCPDPHPRLAAALENTTMADDAPASPMKCAMCSAEMKPGEQLASVHMGCLAAMPPKSAAADPMPDAEMAAKLGDAGAVAAGATLSRATVLAGVALTADVFAALSRETGAKDAAGILGRIQAWKAGAERTAAAEAALHRAQGEAALSRFNGLVEQGKRDGKLSPAQIDSAWIKGMREEPVTGARQLEAFLSAASPLVITKDTAGNVLPATGDGGATLVTSSDIKQLAICGTDIRGFVTHLARQSPGGQAMLSNTATLDAEVARVQSLVDRYRAGERDAADTAAA